MNSEELNLKYAIDYIAFQIYCEPFTEYVVPWHALHVSDKSHYRKLARQRISEFVMELETNKDFKKANK